MTSIDFIAGYHAGYKAAVEHLNAMPGLVLPGNVAAVLSDDTRCNGLAESAAEEHAAVSASDLVLDGTTAAVTVDGVVVSTGKLEGEQGASNETSETETPED